MSKITLLIRELKNHLWLFLREPKNYLYLYAYPTGRKVMIRPYDSRSAEIADRLKEKIKKAIPEIIVRFTGSASLGIAGERDIDLFVESDWKEFPKILPLLIRIFGEPKKKKKKFIEWIFAENGQTIELLLIDPKTKKFRRQINAVETLRKNPRLLKEYENIKLESNGLSVREYQKRKISFFIQHIKPEILNKKNGKKIIIFSSYDDVKNPYYGGGGAMAVHEIAKRLAGEFEVKVLTGAYPGSKNEIIDGVMYVRLGNAKFGPKFGQLVFHLLLWRQILIRKFDLWIESFTPPFSASFLPLLTKKPIIGLAHMLSAEDMARKYKIPFSLIERIGIRHYKNMIALTQELKEKINKLNPAASIEVIGNGFNPPKFTVEQNPKKHILYIGRIEVDQKGLDLLLRSYKEIADLVQNDLIVCGTGLSTEIGKLKNIIKELGLENRVKMLGRVAGEEKEKLYQEAAAVVISSRRESFSLVALEALARKSPLVCFDINGLRWIPENCAVKIKPFDEAALANALKNIIDNPESISPMIEAGWEFGKNQTWDNQYEKYRSYIERILSSV